jgi:chemotaxis signal transduction protein
MNSFLHVTCGPWDLLFDIGHVLEVADVPAAFARASHRPWRERNLPVVDLAARLGQPGRRARQQLVLENADDDQVVVDVENIVGLRDCRPEDAIELPALDARLEHIVDGGWLDRASGTCLLRVRLPLKACHDGTPDAASAALPKELD